MSDTQQVVAAILASARFHKHPNAKSAESIVEMYREVLKVLAAEPAAVEFDPAEDANNRRFNAAMDE